MVDVLNSFAQEGFASVLLVLGGLFAIVGLARVFASFTRGDPAVPGGVMMVGLGLGVLATILPPLNSLMTGPVRGWLGANIAPPTDELWVVLRTVGLLVCTHGFVAFLLAIAGVSMYWFTLWSAGLVASGARLMWERFVVRPEDEEEIAPVLTIVTPGAPGLFTPIGRAS